MCVSAVASPSGRTWETSRSTFAWACARGMPTCSTSPRSYSARCAASHAPYSSSRSGRSAITGSALRARRGRRAGRSTITRWPQSATIRSFAPSRRAYSMPLSTGSCASRAPQRTRVGHEIPPRSRRGSSATIARAAPLRIGVLALRVEQAERRARRQRDGVRDEPGPEDGPAVPGALGVAMAERRDHTARPDRRRGERDRPCDSRRGRDPSRGHEQERAHELGAAPRQPDRDEAAERVARDEGRPQFLLLEHRRRNGSEIGRRRAARQASASLRAPADRPRRRGSAAAAPGSSSTQFPAEPDSPWSSSRGSPSPPTWYRTEPTTLVSRFVAAVMRAEYPPMTMAIPGRWAL